MSKMPSAWVTAGVKKDVSARIDMSAEVAGKGLCPECKKPMELITSSGNRMWACAADRISLPVADSYGTPV